MQVKKMLKNIKAQTQVFMGLIIGLGVLAFGFAVIMALTQGVADQALADAGGNVSLGSYAYNGTVTILEALATIPGWVKLLVLAVVGLALVGVVMLFNRIRSS